jgi:hypothetical protein
MRRFSQLTGDVHRARLANWMQRSGHLRCKVTNPRDPARVQPLTSDFARPQSAWPGLLRNAIFLSCLCRLLWLLPARRTGEAVYGCCRPPVGNLPVPGRPVQLKGSRMPGAMPSRRGE